MVDKRWPDENGTVQFHELCEPVEDAIRQLYRLRFRGYRDVNWKGYNIGKRDLACSFSPSKALNASNLRYSQTDQGRTPLGEIVGVAIQTGIEQGRRVLWEEQEMERHLLELEKEYHSCLDHPKVKVLREANANMADEIKVLVNELETGAKILLNQKAILRCDYDWLVSQARKFNDILRDEGPSNEQTTTREVEKDTKTTE